MKIGKGYLLIGFIFSTAYIYQRAILGLLGQLPDDNAAAQAASSFFGMGVAFSYMGMDMYWPLILSILLFGYLKTELSEEDGFLVVAIEKSRLLRCLALVVLPILTLTIHY